MGDIFFMIIGPGLWKYWPKVHSMRSRGKPMRVIIMMYGTKNAPEKLDNFNIFAK